MPIRKRAKWEITTDNRGHIADVFTLRNIFMSGTSYSPNKDLLVLIGADVDITIDSENVSLSVSKGSFIVLVYGKVYNFSADIALGSA